MKRDNYFLRKPVIIIMLTSSEHFHALPHLILPTTLCIRHDYSPHLNDGETEAHRD